MRGAAWAAPGAAVALAAPAYAASPCVSGTWDYSKYTKDAPDGAFTLNGVAVTTTLTKTPTTNTSTDSVAAETGTVTNVVHQDASIPGKPQNLGGEKAYALMMSVTGNATAALTFTFEPAVRNLVLHVKDLTRGPVLVSTYAVDSLTVSGVSGYSYVDASGGKTNTAAKKLISAAPSPLQRTNEAYNYSQKGATGEYFNADIHVPGPVSRITLTLANAYQPGAVSGAPTKGTAAIGLWGIEFCG